MRDTETDLNTEINDALDELAAGALRHGGPFEAVMRLRALGELNDGLDTQALVMLVAKALVTRGDPAGLLLAPALLGGLREGARA